MMQRMQRMQRSVHGKIDSCRKKFLMRFSRDTVIVDYHKSIVNEDMPEELLSISYEYGHQTWNRLTIMSMQQLKNVFDIEMCERTNPKSFMIFNAFYDVLHRSEDDESDIETLVDRTNEHLDNRRAEFLTRRDQSEQDLIKAQHNLEQSTLAYNKYISLSHNTRCLKSNYDDAFNTLMHKFTRIAHTMSSFVGGVIINEPPSSKLNIKYPVSPVDFMSDDLYQKIEHELSIYVSVPYDYDY